MPAQIAIRIAVAFMLLLLFAHPSHAAEQRLGFVTQVEGEGFFLNPLVNKILVTEVTKGSLADAAGMKAGDQIIQIEGQSVAGKRARELQPFMKLNPGEIRAHCGSKMLMEQRSMLESQSQKHKGPLPGLTRDAVSTDSRPRAFGRGAANSESIRSR